jgi:hypothetical protein
MSKRSFTIVSVEDTHGKAKGKKNLGGRFLSDTPSGAARKAISRICRESAIKGQCTLKVTIRETTQGSQHKEYSYKGKRMMKPVTVQRGDEEITYKYVTKVMKA